MLIAIIHLDHTIILSCRPTCILEVDSDNGTYYWDVGYFVYSIDSIAELRTKEGSFTIDTLDGLFHKNYFSAYLISDLFYFGDPYILNFLTVNIVGVFYSGVLLALIANKLFDNLDTNRRRMVFYLSIIQPIAWIPSNTMTVFFGAVIVVLSDASVSFLNTKIQKISSGILSLALIF